MTVKTRKSLKASGRVFFYLVFWSLLLTPFDAAHALVMLDNESMECVKCHGSSVDSSTPQMVCHGGLCDHPIGVDYALLSSKNPGLVKPSALNPAIRLADGRIGCTSCHVPYDQYNHQTLANKRKDPSIPDPMLSVDNTQSGLCSACHLK